MATHRLPFLAFPLVLSIAHLTTACGDTGTPSNGGTAGNNAAGQSPTGGTAGAPSGGSGGGQAGTPNAGSGGSAGAAGSGGTGGSMMEPEIPGGPDESIPADPGE